MPKIITDTKKQISKMENGQVLLVVAISIVVIVAIMGLALDVGVMFIGNARMRRAVDAAALAAALQFHPKGIVQFNFSDLDTSATEFLILNGIHDANAVVQVCDTPQYHPDPIHTIPAGQCPDTSAGQMERKLVRVAASGTIQLAFLPVIGVPPVPIRAEAISETASVDVVLVIDRSESMTYNAAPDTAARDPSKCNIDNTPPPATLNWDASYQGNCEPFFDVKYAAVKFVESLYFPYDRVSVITFDKDSTVVMDFSNNENTIINNIKGLTVYEGDVTATGPLTGLPGINAIYPIGNPSRYYDMSDPLNPIYKGLACPQREISTEPHYPDPSPCTTTNIGLGMLNAGNEFTINTALVPQRKNSLWVTILLTDGVANAGYDLNHLYYCPALTWPNVDIYDFSVTPPVLQFIDPKCNDADSSTHHTPPSSPSSYDAEDYAYDQVDNVIAEQSLIFTIGLGKNVITPSSVDGIKLGERFLKYAAGCLVTNECTGLYTFAPDSSQLEEIFRTISQNIATRLEH